MELYRTRRGGSGGGSEGAGSRFAGDVSNKFDTLVRDVMVLALSVPFEAEALVASGRDGEAVDDEETSSVHISG